LVDAVSTYRASPRQIELAAACEDAGGALLRVGRDSEAAALLDEAAAVHLSCGAIADLARVDAMLRAQGIRRRRRGPSIATHGWEALSPTERSVVDLVAQGMSNPKIGAHLYISRRTVETHVSHIFRKLDVANRAQLAAAATSHAADAPTTRSPRDSASPPTTSSVVRAERELDGGRR
ncbi:MAG: helix-turn-helix transcriptional regulator, partial [Ilumatobacteraceae bacterium]